MSGERLVRFVQFWQIFQNRTNLRFCHILSFGDFLLHDVGTGDGIFQAGPQDTVNKLRTAPLWGVRMKARLMHDLASPTPQDAIERHAGEARHVTRRFGRLTAAEKQQLITFLNSL